jgi:hypothetical protein
LRQHCDAFRVTCEAHVADRLHWTFNWKIQRLQLLQKLQVVDVDDGSVRRKNFEREVGRENIFSHFSFNKLNSETASNLRLGLIVMISGFMFSENLRENKVNEASNFPIVSNSPQISLLVGDKILHYENASGWIHHILTRREVYIPGDIRSQSKNSLREQTNRLVHRELLFLFHFINFE